MFTTEPTPDPPPFLHCSVQPAVPVQLPVRPEEKWNDREQTVNRQFREVWFWRSSSKKGHDLGYNRTRLDSSHENTSLQQRLPLKDRSIQPQENLFKEARAIVCTDGGRPMIQPAKESVGD
ncbi:hypothetical protein Bbelb_077710 [Branchiostoma belcheri]|nr:hypothetical protein Bbelb_077710 [Branchiostoma belcheri]